MTRIKPYIISVIFLLLFQCCEEVKNISPERLDSPSTGQPYFTENVVIVVIDGPRYSETWGDPSKQFIPNQFHLLGPQGIQHAHFYNNGPTYTSSGHTSITTGKYQIMDNSGDEFPKSPSIFQLWLNESKSSPEKAQIITSKEKLHILGDCSDLKWRGKFNPKVNAIGRSDTETFEAAIKAFEEDQPNLVLLHFKGPDYYGHHNNWEEYLNSIKLADQLVYQVWEYLQHHPAYTNKTTLLITNDHGRHLDHIKDGFISHGDYCEGCRHISLFAMGPDFNSDRIETQQSELIDIAPTVADLLGFPLPDSNGRIMTNLYK